MKLNQKNTKVRLILALIMISFVLSGYTIIINAENVSFLQPIILDDDLYQKASRDPFTFGSFTSNKSYVLNKDMLKLFVQYSGGCEDHEFLLIGPTGFLESKPVQINLLLSHNANNDRCEAYLSEELEFDLTPLKIAWQQIYQQESGTIVIQISGLETSIFYTFGNNITDEEQGRIQVSTEKETYKPGEIINIDAIFINEGKINISLSSLSYNLTITGPLGKVLTEMGIKIFIAPLIVAVNSTADICSYSWNQTGLDFKQVNDGEYIIKVELIDEYYFGVNTIVISNQTNQPELNNITLTLTTDKTSYQLNETISLSIMITNIGEENVTLTTPSLGLGVDFEVFNERGEQVYLWSYGKAFPEALGTIIVKTGETIFFNKTWNQTDTNGNLLPTGNYTLKGIIHIIGPNLNTNIVRIFLEGQDVTPGFEALLIIIAVGVTLIILRYRKEK
jgi:hypothetical protein